MAETTHKLLVGTLLAGAAVLTGDVTLLATASGIGVNWASEALPQLVGERLSAGSPLAQAGGKALRKALSDLEKQFRTTVNPNTERKSFGLLREAAGAVVDPAYPVGASSLADLQTTVASSLGELLHGHDAQEVAFLRQHLLAAVARRFREELDSDDTAWRAFHGRLIEQLHARAAQPNPPPDLSPLLTRIDNQQQALDALRNGDAEVEQQLARLQELIEQLEQGTPPSGDEVSFRNTQLKVGGSLNQAAGDIGGSGTTASGAPAASRSPRKTMFENQGVEVKGDVNQAGGNIYQNSAHAQGDGSAVVNNITGNQTNIHGGATGPVLSGTFTGPINIGGNSALPASASGDPERERQELLREKKRRLHQRELTAARYGINTPPEVAIEIEDLKREIAALEHGG